jgi:hypothetical protein
MRVTVHAQRVQRTRDMPICRESTRSGSSAPAICRENTRSGSSGNREYGDLQGKSKAHTGFEPVLPP